MEKQGSIFRILEQDLPEYLFGCPEGSFAFIDTADKDRRVEVQGGGMEGFFGLIDCLFLQVDLEVDSGNIEEKPATGGIGTGNFQ